MAKIKMEGLDDYIKQLTELGESVEGSIKRAVYPAAGMVIGGAIGGAIGD